MNSIQSNDKKNNLYIKVQNAIKNAKLDKYYNDKEKISEEGITFFGGFTGKNSLQIEKLKNVKLKIELLQAEKLGSKSEYETEDLLSDLFACAITELSGKFSPEMEKLYKQLKEKAEKENKPNSDEYIYELACRKIDNSQNYLPIIHEEKPKGIFGDIRVQTSFLKLENKKLENEIIIQRGKSQFETFKNSLNKKSVIVPVDWQNRKNV